MATERGSTSDEGFFARSWRRLTTPSARWSVLSLLFIGFLIGAALAGAAASHFGAWTLLPPILTLLMLATLDRSMSVGDGHQE